MFEGHRTEFAIGERVRTAGSFFSPSRTDKVAGYRVSSVGALLYVLADGGWFTGAELESRR